MKKVIQIITKKTFRISFIKFLLDYSPFIFSSFALFLEFYPRILNPMFSGDSGTRLKNANLVIWNEGGGRFWMPFLQLLIHIFYLLRIEFSLYKLIPFFFSLGFLIAFTTLSNKYLRGYRLKSLIALIILIFFVTNPLLVWLSNNLYQEMPIIALFYILLYLLYLKNNEIFIGIIWAIALLTREYFLIYYVVFGFINRKKIVSKVNNILRYFVFLLIPIAWILYTKQSLITGFNANATPITMEIISSRIYRLFAITQYLGLMPSIISIVIIFILFFKNLIKKEYKVTVFEGNYLVLSFFSLLIIYSYIIIKDPWAMTPYNSRMLFPLVIMLPLLYLISFKYLLTRPNILKRLLAMALTLCLLQNIHLPSLSSMKVTRSPFFQEINTTLSLAKKLNKDKPLKIGIIGIDYWNEYILLFAGPLLYEKGEYLTDSKKILNYQLLVTSTKNNYQGFTKCKTVSLNEKTTFNILCRR